MNRWICLKMLLKIGLNLLIKLIYKKTKVKLTLVFLEYKL